MFEFGNKSRDPYDAYSSMEEGGLEPSTAAAFYDKQVRQGFMRKVFGKLSLDYQAQPDFSFISVLGQAGEPGSRLPRFCDAPFLPSGRHAVAQPTEAGPACQCTAEDC
jgi:hypothetical protein